LPSTPHLLVQGRDLGDNDRPHRRAAAGDRAARLPIAAALREL